MRSTYNRQSMWQVIVGLVVMTSVLLAGCGRPDVPISAAAQQQVQATERPTPTLSSLDKTQQAIDERLAHEIQTAAAHPTPETLPPLPTNRPGTILTGLTTDCETAAYTNIIRSTNCWLDIVNSEYLFFVAGADTDNSSQGKIGFYTVSLDETQQSDLSEFPTPTQHGAVTITAVAPPRFTLTADDSTIFVFNVETRTWENPGSTPVPTPVTPTPTPGPAAPDVIVRHAPTINGSVQITGDVQQLLGEDLTLSSGVIITGDLRLPGSPTISCNEPVTLGTTVTGSGSPEPSGYRLTLNSGVQLSRLVTQTDPVALPSVAAPPQPSGTRDVTLTQPGESFGDPATLHNPSLNSNVGDVTVPPGAYGQFMVNDGSTLVLGVAGASEPALYTLQALTLNGSGGIRLAGPVTLTLASGLTWSGSVGSPDHPEWLTLQVASGSVTLNSGAAFFGTLQAPACTVALNGNNTLRGAIRVDRLMLNAGSRIEAGSSTP